MRKVEQAQAALLDWRLEDTITLCNEELKQGPQENAYDLLATAHYQLCDFDRSRHMYEHGLKVFPTSPALLFQKSLALLNQGKWDDGFRLWQYRLSRRKHIVDIAKYCTLKEWDKLPCEHMLLIMEHGLGDQIMFARYLPLVRPFTKKLSILTSYAPIKRFFQECGIADHVICNEDKITLSDYDCWIGLESLPTLFGAPVRTFPLQPVEPRSAIKRVGICWMSSPRPEPHRRMTWKEFAPIVQIPGLEFVNLQYGVECPDRKVANTAIGDIQSTSEIINGLDAVVSVDTCVAHLAATKGVPTLVLRSLPHEWRWGKGESEWYPDVKVYLQSVRGDWTAPVQQVVAALQGRYN